VGTIVRTVASGVTITITDAAIDGDVTAVFCDLRSLTPCFYRFRTGTSIGLSQRRRLRQQCLANAPNASKPSLLCIPLRSRRPVQLIDFRPGR
jgi:hypothetical protein